MPSSSLRGVHNMIKAHSAFGAGCALLALSACTTHLDVDHALPSDPASRRGIAYFLPFTQFDTKTTWTLAACDAQGIPEIAVSFAATPVSAPDPDHLYTIDYSSLDAISKTSSVKVDFHDSGAIKSINASAEDRTAEIAGKAISEPRRTPRVFSAPRRRRKYSKTSRTRRASLRSSPRSWRKPPRCSMP